MDLSNIFTNIIFFIILINGYNIVITIVGIVFILLRLLIHNLYNIVIIVTLFSFLNHVFIYEGLNRSYPQTCNCIFIMQDNALKRFFFEN
jgi:hypothetical protein